MLGDTDLIKQRCSQVLPSTRCSYTAQQATSGQTVCTIDNWPLPSMRRSGHLVLFGRKAYPHIEKLRGNQTDLTCVNTKEGRQYIAGCVADQWFFHLNAKDSWQGMLGSSTKKLTLSEEPLLVAIQLHHVYAAVHMRHVELLPALACMHSWTCMSLFYISSLLLLK